MYQYLLPIALVSIPFIAWFFLFRSVRKQAVKDWATLRYLKKKANEVSTKKEIKELHIEFLEKAKLIHNEHISPELKALDGFLRGLYKNIQKNA